MIRMAQAADCAALAAIDAQSNVSPWSATQFQTAIDGRLDTVLVWAKNNVIQGFAVWQTVCGESELHLIATAPQARRQGIAAQLMAAWLQTANTQPIQRFLLEVRSSNAPALALYRQLGFVQNGVRPAYYPNPDGSREDAILMEKTC